MKVYHYTEIKDWKDIKAGSYRSKNIPGLGANRRVGREDREAWNTGAVFCFLEPVPTDWVHNTHFKLTWDAIKHDIQGRMLLEITVDENTPAYVIDRGLAEGHLYKEKTDIPKGYLFPTRKDAEAAYIQSKVPLKEFIEKRQDYNFSLPEVIITEDVPLEKVKISEKQPFLEEDLEKYKNTPIFMEDIMRDINSIPELKAWYEKRKEFSKTIANEMSPKLR